MLYHQDYINEYDQYMRLPLYVAYTVQNKTRTKSQPNKCIRPDIRLPQESSSKCIEYGSASEAHVSHSFLYPSELSTGVAVHDASVETNVVPMYDSTQEVWNYIANVVSQWSNVLGDINVIAGPVFDYDYDGHRDNMAKLMRIGKFTKIGINSVPVPTHFFMILSRCKQCTDNINMTSPNDVDLLSFVVPNYAEEPCHETDQTPSEWIPNTLKEHVARIRDVELLTGISFLPIWTHSRDVHQETRIEAIRLRLNLPGSDNQWMKLFLNEPLDYS
uniref:Extracellular Endonuclease subunit A domain-containing protein n=1 Tax=Ciona savignyi TaxID=51511 RepID=H2ZDI1_CIOSA